MKTASALPQTLLSRVMFGGIAGFCATAAMTSAMSRLHRSLPAKERYPLPPREITAAITGLDDPQVRDAAMAAHFAYGAACGALVAALRPEPGMKEGAAAGVAIWAGSYFGWAPGLNILKPASEHPPRRNALMIAAHLVWGAATALTLRELGLARRTMLNEGPARDAAGAGRENSADRLASGPAR